MRDQGVRARGWVCERSGVSGQGWVSGYVRDQGS